MSEYTGKDVSYYLVEIAAPKRLDPYTAECEDIIEALGMSFAEGCAFKAIWRKCAARTLGVTKAGYKGGLYDAEKTQYYGARMVAAEERLVPGAPGYELLIKCEECKTVSRGGRLHVCTCSQLTAPEEYKAEAQVAFDEATGALFDDLVGQARVTASANWLAEKIARQVSAGTIVEPAAAMDDDSPRMQAIGQNGNDGEHYDDPFAGAPEWAKYKAQDANGQWYWYECDVYAGSSQWLEAGENGRLDEAEGGEPNPNWRYTLVTRT